MKEHLQELIGLIYDLNESDGPDWHISFSGHVKSVGVHYTFKDTCGDCGAKREDAVWLAHVAGDTELPGLIKTVKTFLPKEG